MERYEPATWGDRYAPAYDELLSLMAPGETEAAVEVLFELAGGGPALELGIGTGRVALPLVERGIDVHGIDASPEMGEKLRQQPGGDRIPFTVGDIAAVTIEGQFRLAFAVHNTFSLLLTEEDQIRCLQNVARQLTDDGILVIEAAVPVQPDERGQSFTIWSIEDDRLMVSFSKHDPVTRSMKTLELWLSDDGIRTFPSRERPLPPAELDAMAEQAGLRLRDRWDNWDRTPFTASSTYHVSVYEKTQA